MLALDNFDEQNTSAISFQAMDRVERLLQKVDWDEITYFTFHDRSSRTDEHMLGRLDLIPKEVWPWVESPYVNDEQPPVKELPPTHAMHKAILAWCHHMAIQNMSGESWRRFRLKAWRPNGGYKFSAQFICQDDDVLDNNMVLDDPEKATKSAVTLTVHDIGGLYRTFGRDLLNGTRQIDGLRSREIDRLSGQLESKEAQITGLVDKIINTRKEDLDRRDGILKTREKQAHHSQVTAGVVDRISGAVEGIVFGKLPPEIQQLAIMVKQNPGLAELANNQVARRILSNPKSTKNMLKMLDDFGDMIVEHAENDGDHDDVEVADEAQSLVDASENDASRQDASKNDHPNQSENGLPIQEAPKQAASGFPFL